MLPTGLHAAYPNYTYQARLVKLTNNSLMVFFLSILVSDYFYNQGLGDENSRVKENSFSKSKQFLPVDAEIFYRYYLEVLKRGQSEFTGNNEKTKLQKAKENLVHFKK